MKGFWKDLKPVTRCVLISVIGIVLIAAMYFGIIDKDVVSTVVQGAK